MASTGTRKNTLAKLQRVRALQERRELKAAKKAARKRAAAEPAVVAPTEPPPE